MRQLTWGTCLLLACACGNPDQVSYTGAAHSPPPVSGSGSTGMQAGDGVRPAATAPGAADELAEQSEDSASGAPAPSHAPEWLVVSPSYVQFSGMATDRSGDILLTAAGPSWLLKYDRHGHLLWERSELVKLPGEPMPGLQLSFSQVTLEPHTRNIYAFGGCSYATGSCGRVAVRLAPDGTAPELVDYSWAGKVPRQFAKGGLGLNLARTEWTSTVEFFQDGRMTWSLRGRNWLYGEEGIDPLDIAFDSAGEVLVAGQLFGRFELEGVMLGRRDEEAVPVLVKLRADRTLRWAHVGTGLRGSVKVAAGPHGEVVALVCASGHGTFAGVSFQASEGECSLLALDADGSRRWAQRLQPHEPFGAIAVDEHGGVALLDKPPCDATRARLRVRRFDPAGTLRWTYETPTSSCVDGHVSAKALAFSQDGVLVAGYFRGTVDFGTGPQSTTAPATAFLLQLGR